MAAVRFIMAEILRRVRDAMKPLSIAAPGLRSRAQAR
jgi:hypothetical protein